MPDINQVLIGLLGGLLGGCIGWTFGYFKGVRDGMKSILDEWDNLQAIRSQWP